MGPVKSRCIPAHRIDLIEKQAIHRPASLHVFLFTNFLLSPMSMRAYEAAKRPAESQQARSGGADK
jgi:hypothetical protein